MCCHDCDYDDTVDEDISLDRLPFEKREDAPEQEFFEKYISDKGVF